ncbi:hypothetical protein AVEN_148453-1 [Araneus ventricosus]|uniref:Uncharacterized protein n=1 Tax=Araneus ventricosus TaxID=182803 RepID=A0A4Y2BIR5_ARAVE|nr:hypothetical protein AVEN_148453-1 [Araneus ventricosus]
MILSLEKTLSSGNHHRPTTVEMNLLSWHPVLEVKVRRGPPIGTCGFRINNAASDCSKVASNQKPAKPFTSLLKMEFKHGRKAIEVLKIDGKLA